MAAAEALRSPGRWLVLLALLVSPRPATAQAPPPPPAWLTGCWQQQGPSHTIDEIWLPSVGGATVGLSRTMAGDTLVLWELMVIRPSSEGLVFEASPRGQAPASFPVIEFTDSSIAFENPAHDFPQQIRYLRRSADSLHAAISGTVGGRARTIHFAYARASCPGPEATRGG